MRKQINFTGFVSEQLGEIGLQGYILKEYPDAVRMLYSSKGAGVFDGVWYLDNKNDKSITWLIGEAKGAAGEPSVRQIGNKLYEQGTIEHTRDTITSMGSKVKNDPNLEFLVKSLGNALDLNLSSSSSVTFIKVTVPTPVSDVNGNLVLAPLKVEEWKLR